MRNLQTSIHCVPGNFDERLKEVNPNQQLAAEIRKRFTPFAFKCDCKGENESCAKVLNDPIELNIYMTIEKIARYIEELA